MTANTIQFHYGLFYHAMIALLGRVPDKKYCAGFDGYYTIRYEPKDEAEAKKFADDVAILQQWLGLFEITPLSSRCEFGRLVHPQPKEEGKDYLDIVISHAMTKKDNS